MEGEATYTSTSSVTYNGVTLNFAAPVMVANFFTGPPVILTNGVSPVVTSITPASGIVDGYLANGGMLDPANTLIYPVPSSSQGFEGSIATGTVVKTTIRVPYDDALNKHPSISGDMAIPANGSHCYVQSVRRAGGEGGYRSVEKFVPIYFLPYTIKTDEFPPPMSRAAYTGRHRLASVDYGVLRNMTMPTGARDRATSRAAVPDVFPFFGWIAEQFRAFHNYPLVDSGYSAYYGKDLAKLVASLHWSGTNASKEENLTWVVKTAINIYGVFLNGMTGGSGAGQWHGYHEILYHGAFILQNADMLAAAQTMRSNMVTPYRYASLTELGRNAAFPDVYMHNRPFFAEEIGLPHYFGDGVGADFTTRRYSGVATPSMIESIGPCMVLQNGPAGISGVDAIMQGSFNSSNVKSAPIAVADRFRNLTPNFFANANSQVENETYDAFRDLMPFGRWIGIPDIINTADSTTRFTGGAASITWNFAGYNWASEAVTNRRIMVSLDGMLGPVVSGAALTGSISTGLLLGVPHYCQIAQDTASGVGRYSANYPWLPAGPERNKATPTGTDTNAAPSYSGRVQPQIMHAERGDWAGPSWIYSATPTSEILRFKCAVGYPSGYPAPVYPAGFTFQWKLDGVNIAGATSAEYTRDFLAAGVLTCAITVTNSTGSVSITTGGITIPAIPVDPATTLIKTEFGPEWPLKYASIRSSMTMTAATRVEWPYQGWGRDDEWPYDLEALGAGAIQSDKTTSSPRMIFQIPGLVNGRTYRVRAEVAANYGAQIFPYATGWSVDGGFRLGKTSMGTDYKSLVMAKGDGNPRQLLIDESFTASATGDLYVSMLVNTSTGGGAGGDIWLSSLWVEDVT